MEATLAIEFSTLTNFVFPPFVYYTDTFGNVRELHMVIADEVTDDDVLFSTGPIKFGVDVEPILTGPITTGFDPGDDDLADQVTLVDEDEVPEIKFE